MTRADRLPTLTVAFSTRGERARGLDPARWPRVPGVEYLVLVQEAAIDLDRHLAEIAERPDARVVRLSTTGLSRSRNAALVHAEGDIILLADDDVIHPPGAYAAVRTFFHENPDISLLAGLSLNPDGTPHLAECHKTLRSRPLTVWNSGRTASHELAFRREAVLSAGIRFDERFGAGSGTPNFIGEEYIFIADCLRARLHGIFRPTPISIHPPYSSGLLWEGGEAARARVAILSRVFGRAAPLVRLGFALKNRRRFVQRRDIWRFIFG